MTATLPSLIFADDSNVTATPVLLVDEDGNYVAAGGGGGGGGAVTIADGADIAQGAVADASYSDVTGAAVGTLISLNKGQYVLTAARLGGLTEAAPATDTASSGLNGRMQRIAQRITSLIALLPAALGAGGGLKIDGSGTALPVSAAALPLPTGAATEVTLLAQSAKLPASLGIKTAVGSLSIAPASDATFAVTGAFFQATQPISAAALPLPAGAATAAGLTTINTTLGTPFQAGGSIGNTTFAATQATASNLNAQVVGAGASAAARVGNPVAIAFTYNSGVATPSNGQALDAQCDANGALKVTPWTGNATGGDAVNNTGPIFSTAAGTIAAVRTYASLFNGSTWDRQRGDANGLVNQQYAMASSRWNYATPTGGIVNTTTPVTIISAAGVGVRNYLTALQIDFDALVTATEFVVQDDTAGAILFRAKLPSGVAGSRTYNFPVPLKGTANKIMQVVTLTATGAVVGVFPNAQGFQGV